MKIQWSILILVLILEACTGVQKPIDVYMVGDSTMSDKKAEVYPETGWGQVFDEFFDEQVTVHNHAVNGRSTKSFITEGRWQTVLDSLKQGDYVFIQFGHNDQKDQDSARYTDPYGTYSQNLEKYVRESRDKGATPILLTSIVRRKFDENGQLLDTHGDYPLAMRAVAKELDVGLIDLQKLTADLVQSMGDEPSKEVYLWTEPNDRFPEGRQDDTHLRVVGAKKVAELVANELVKLPNDLAGRVVQQN
ncbi:rhamnogalacturonan acetylesterase [uncultured Sunxiuqinia sp.]|uniref:rhamnogalacturonan acetylesterase n=1 Tax=uncultured Sunxiuqinia sp. TaxID=1573825 RepID=UPI0019980E3C|nr:rhamnogalacturonan acetylesterase [Sunxiuqinia sp.]